MWQRCSRTLACVWRSTDGHKVRHNSKVKQGQASKDGYWELKPQGQTKTIKNQLNAVFEEDFVVTTTAALSDQK